MPSGKERVVWCAVDDPGAPEVDAHKSARESLDDPRNAPLLDAVGGVVQGGDDVADANRFDGPPVNEHACRKAFVKDHQIGRRALGAAMERLQTRDLNRRGRIGGAAALDDAHGHAVGAKARGRVVEQRVEVGEEEGALRRARDAPAQDLGHDARLATAGGQLHAHGAVLRERGADAVEEVLLVGAEGEGHRAHRSLGASALTSRARSPTAQNHSVPNAGSLHQ